MRDIVLEAPDQDRYTYFIAFYGKGFSQKTGLLQIEHDFSVSVRDLHTLIRQKINQVLGADTPSCYQIFALAAPEPIPAFASPNV